MSDLKKIAKRMQKAPYVPSCDDPLAELRRLVAQHKAVTKSSVQLTNSSTDKTILEGERKGEKIPCNLPEEVRLANLALAEANKKAAQRLATPMMKELRKVPLYTEFLAKVDGVGPMVAAYLCTDIDFTKCEKPSNLKSRCGLGVTNGKADRPTKGQVLKYNKALKTALWQMMTLGVRMACSKAVKKGGAESKYMTVWRQKKETLIAIRGKGTADNKSDGWCDQTARRKATDVFLEDLYIVGRTLAGLPVWPSWYAKAMGYEHGGKVAVLAPKMLTLPEALALTGVAGAEDVEMVDDMAIAAE